VFESYHTFHNQLHCVLVCILYLLRNLANGD
jgi:hypothetical protein